MTKHALVVLMLAATALGACGKKADVKPPPGSTSTFPRGYPAPQPDPQPNPQSNRQPSQP